MLTGSTTVLMLIVCWVPTGEGTLREAWRIEKTASLEHCLTMNNVVGLGGKAGVFLVQCKVPR